MSDVKYHDLINDCDVIIDPAINVQLLDEELWDEIFPLMNEMYATTLGSSLVPELRIRITGLDRFDLYSVCIEFEPLSKNRLKYTSRGQWVIDQVPSSHEHKIGYMHPESYQNGFAWMEKPVTFSTMKISVNEVATKASGVRDIGSIVFLNLHSKYAPVIKIFKLEDAIFMSEVYSKTLDICQFITVVSYRNPKMIEKKGREAENREEVYLLRREERSSSSPRTFPFENSIRDLNTFVPKTLKVQDMKRIDNIWSSTLFQENRMNFFTFVELYQIKNTISHERYSLNKFINEIKNNNLNFPNVNLNISIRSEEGQTGDSEAANVPERTSTPFEEGAVGESVSEVLTEFDNLLKESFLQVAPGLYIVDNACPLEDFLNAYLIYQSKLPHISEEVLEELRNLTPLFTSTE